MADFTKEQKEKYIDSPNHCPDCGSDQLEGGPFMSDCDCAWQDISCLSCDTEWSDIYKLIDVEKKENI